jgi:hypothetical protein
MDHVTPLFIFGMGRSGTTNALRVLNLHPEVMLNGEIAIPVLKQFFRLLEQVDASQDKQEERRDGWYERKAEFMFESFGFLAKGGRGRLHKREDAQYLGHKTPRLETMFDEYEGHFASVGMKPRYFYCARNPFDCWRSYLAASWSRYESVEEFLAHYAQSFATLERIRQVAGGRLEVLNLDELKAASDPVAFYRERLFAPLDLEVGDVLLKRLHKIAAERAERGATPAISDADRAAILAWPGIAELHEAMFAPYLAKA